MQAAPRSSDASLVSKGHIDVLCDLARSMWWGLFVERLAPLAHVLALHLPDLRDRRNADHLRRPDRRVPVLRHDRFLDRYWRCDSAVPVGRAAGAVFAYPRARADEWVVRG